MPSITPGLIDLFFPREEEERNEFKNLFVVMEASDIDLKTMMNMA